MDSTGSAAAPWADWKSTEGKRSSVGNLKL